MTTLYGGPIPPDFTDGEQLTAAGFNAVKNYWVIDGELPEEAEDGDVVFAIGEVAGGGDVLPGVGGWATIAQVESPDIDVPVYTDSEGIEWKAYIWENPRVMTSGTTLAPNRELRGSITLAEEGLIEVIICAGGGSGYANAGGGGAGGIIATVVYAQAGTHEIYVGSGSRSTDPGGGSSVGEIGIGGGSYRSSGNSGNGFTGYSATTPGAGATGDAYFDYDPDVSTVVPGPGITLNWADGVTDVVYGYGGDYSYSAAQPPGFGWGGTVQPTTDTGVYNPGANGVVLIRTPLNYASQVQLVEMTAEHESIRQADAQAYQEAEQIRQAEAEGEDQ